MAETETVTAELRPLPQKRQVLCHIIQPPLFRQCGTHRRTRFPVAGDRAVPALDPCGSLAFATWRYRGRLHRCTDRGNQGGVPRRIRTTRALRLWARAAAPWGFPLAPQSGP